MRRGVVGSIRVRIAAKPGKTELSRGHLSGRMGVTEPDPPPLATLERAGGDLGGDLCQVFYRPRPGQVNEASAKAYGSHGAELEGSGRPLAEA